MKLFCSQAQVGQNVAPTILWEIVQGYMSDLKVGKPRTPTNQVMFEKYKLIYM
jgi:hypothetical protein